MFNPRLRQILLLLLNTQEPISPLILAQKCKSSKRTIYRELSDIDKQLKKYRLKLNSKIKQGITLEGTTEDKRKLLEEFAGSELFNPRDREERQKKLIIELLRQDKPLKIYHYAELLQVSETTVSTDLESLAQWFEKSRIKLVRKTGVGIFLQYHEIDFRKMVYHYVLEDLEEDCLQRIREGTDTNIQELLDVTILLEILNIIESPPMNREIVRMTEQSFIEFMIYIAISIKRIQEGKPLQLSSTEIEMVKNDNQYEVVAILMKQLAQAFQLTISPDETVNIFYQYQGRKLQSIEHEAVKKLPNEQIHELKTMIFEMCNAFDAGIAFELKQDEDFINGFIAHLQPTLTRLKHQFTIENPLLTDIKSIYPDIFGKSQEAAKVLEQKIGYGIPEEEIGFLALHFGGAIVRIKNSKKISRRILIGVVCASGIGISSLLSSKLEHLYRDKIQVKIFSNKEIRYKENLNVHMLVTTFDLEKVEIPVIKVHPMLTEVDIGKISEAIDHIKHTAQAQQGDEVEAEDFDEKILIVNEMNQIVNSFVLHVVDGNQSFDAIVRYVSQLFTNQPAHIQAVYQSLWEREKLDSQIIPEYELALLHTKTTAVDNSKIAVIIPQQGTFQDPYMKGSKAVVLILIPEDDFRQTLAISSVSSALFEHEMFLENIKSGDKDKVLSNIKRYLNQYFEEYLLSKHK